LFKNINGISVGFIFLIQVIFASDVYQSVRVFNPTSETLEIVGKAGIPLDHISGKKGYFIDVTSTEDQTIFLISHGINIEILIPNMTQHYRERNIPSSSREFPLGSMMGNYTLDELNDRFDELQAAYPEIISERVILGQSVEGRDIWAFKVSDNPEEDEDEPEVLFTSLTHAREPVGMMNLIYFVQLLGENYGTDSELTFLVNEREIWFIPIVNPDGYVYNETIQPSGGGMHRKNRLDTNCGNDTGRGVDLNRNYSYGWGANNTGSSPDPCSAVYRGDSAFSEPETQSVRDFVIDHEFMNVMHYHTYTNVYIHAFGDASLPDEPDLTTHRDIGNEMARYNGYPVGTGFELIGYTVNGDAVDWSFGDQELVAFTPEVGSYSQGFWPSEDDILSLCEDQVHPNKIFSFVAGADLILVEAELDQNFYYAGNDFELEFEIQNRGLTDLNQEIQIEILPLNDWAIIPQSNYVINGLNARESGEINVGVSLAIDAQNGFFTGLIVSIESPGTFTRQDTINILIGEPEILFFDGFENGISNWYVTGDWGLTTDASTGDYAMSDSPNGDYDEGQESVAEIEIELNLSNLSIPTVTFTAFWDIESNWDFVRFQADVDGLGWVSLAGNFTESGSGQPAQPMGEPGYDGLQEDWVSETVDLDQLDNSQISGFRFIQTSDNYVGGNGFTVDNFTISGFQLGTMGDFNFDNSVNIYDVLGIADLMLFGGDANSSQLEFCDFNENGILDLDDLLSILNLIIGQI
jgi:hypothetical protein